MIEKPKVSVVIPIYNSELYLKDTIESVLNQTLKDIEIILVNDGSTDNSSKICELYKEIDDRIKVIHKENGGLSDARNVGILNANGEYISFVDSDDTIESSMYEELYNCAKKQYPEMVDLIDCGFTYINLVYRTSTQNLHKHPKNIVYDRKYILDKVIPPLINLVDDEDHFIYSFVTNKLFKLSIIKKYDIKFNKKFIKWEDRPFLVDYIYRANTILFYDKCFYNYIGRTDSLSSKYNPDEFELILATFNRYEELFGKRYNLNGEYAIKHKINAIMITIDGIFKNEFKLDRKKKVMNILSNSKVREWYINLVNPSFFQKYLRKFILKENYILAYRLLTLRFSRVYLKLESFIKKFNQLYKRIKNKIKRMLCKKS